MIETVDLSTFKLKSNFILVKADSDYDVVVVPGPEGTKVELKIISVGTNNEASAYSISGTIIKRPDTIFYFNKYSDQASKLSQQGHASAIKASCGVNTSHPYQEGDKVYYNYNVQLSCEEENRLIETDEYGICMLIPIDSLFGYVKHGEIVPVNGYVFFERDTPNTMSASGLIHIPEPAQNAYEKNMATVISASEPVRGYLDGGAITMEQYEKGDRIVIDKRFGYKMAYDLYADELKGVEICFYKHVIAKMEAA
jgi:co-chaperonin GroES (HSP10)